MNVAAALERGDAYLVERGVPEAKASVEFMLAEILGVGRGQVHLRASQELTEKQGHHFQTWLKERGRRVPLAYITGHQPFLGIDIAVTRDSLIPRPETEELVLECERLLRSAKLAAPKILEVGTGTGCVAIALAQLLPQATVFATDVSDKALDLARKNALSHHVSTRIRFVREDLFSGREGLRGWADILVSNPPYIPTKDLDALEPEVKCEPRLALDGGKDGLDAVRAIVASAPKLLKPGGFIALEMEQRQGPAVSKLLHAAGFTGVAIKKDAQGLDRFAIGRLPG
ncbi:MAG TPA: peptide chain release factor N(5)-glutamine methyltransferase [Elusimicrobiota bacterium]|jgi:release factor glutamine methyltransferase|nr:peptide chain release factor N(5)-glutamine methyltransferase [Elusimicrobiota bacterium]